MPDWSELLTEINASGSTFDQIRRKYIKKLYQKTGRNVIVYYSGWQQKGILAQRGVRFDINDLDKNGFMTAVHRLDRSKGLDLLLHTPGGSAAAAESLVDYLRKMFGRDIRAVIPQLAMSAGTLVALSCRSIVMGKQSSLGPIDPQVGGPMSMPAHGVLEEFRCAREEILKNQMSALYWQPILQKYSPTLVGECDKAIRWCNQMARDWLASGMFHGQPDGDAKADKIVQELGDHALTLAHDRHISIDKARDLGLTVEAMEDDSDLQDAILTVHHACVHSLAATSAVKIIENSRGQAFILNATPMVA